VASAFRRKIHISLLRQLQHSMRDVEADGELDVRRCRGHDVTGSAREIEHAVGRLQAGEVNQTPLPTAILSVGEKPCNEVVAVSDGGKQPPDVALLAVSGRDRLP
jgi:hypothetical protein